MKIRVCICDEHCIVRLGLRALIDARTDMEVVHETGDPRESVRIAAEKQPDIVVMEASIPVEGEVHAIRAIRQRSPRTRVLVYSRHEDPACVRSAMAAGASGYVAKRSVEQELITGIIAVHRGHIHIDAALRDRVCQSLAVVADVDTGTAIPPIERLSQRERQVLELLVRGHSNREIAGKLYVGIKSIETYRTRLGRKLGLMTRADFVRYGLDTGLSSQNSGSM